MNRSASACGSGVVDVDAGTLSLGLNSQPSPPVLSVCRAADQAAAFAGQAVTQEDQAVGLLASASAHSVPRCAGRAAFAIRTAYPAPERGVLDCLAE